MFYRYLWKRKFNVLLFMALAVAGTVSDTVFQLFIAPLFDLVQVGQYQQVIVRLSWMFLWYLSYRLLNYYSELAAIYVINAVRKDIKQDLFSAAITRLLPDHADKNTGEYIAEFTNDITIIENKFLIPCKEIFSYIITIVATGVAIFTIDIRMALVILAGAALCVLIPVLTTNYTSGRMMSFLSRFDHFVQHLKDLFGAFFTFKNYAIEDRVIEVFSEENRKVEDSKYKAEMALIIMNNIVGRISWSIELLVVIIGLIGVINGQLSIGSVFAAYMLAGNLGRPLQSFAGRVSSTRSVKGIEKKFMALHKAAKIRSSREDDEKETGLFDIELENVKLRIKDKVILDDISFVFEKGKKYLIIGNNGSGKSTMAKILKSNYRSYSGNVKLNGYPLNSEEGAGYVRWISYSNENVSLLSDTVRNNILLYRNCTEERLNQAIKMADFTLPLEREVGENGRFLSSGERRKLEIARSLIADPKVLIFDEVVSTLDVETAYEIEKLILSLNERTVIMISNAFSGQLLDSYDQIILMHDGKIIAHGRHRELLESCSEYQYIYNIRCGGRSE